MCNKPFNEDSRKGRLIADKQELFTGFTLDCLAEQITSNLKWIVMTKITNTKSLLYKIITLYSIILALVKGWRV